MPGETLTLPPSEQYQIRELHRMLKLCAQAYESLATVPQSSPHARFDLLDWMPLDP